MSVMLVKLCKLANAAISAGGRFHHFFLPGDEKGFSSLFVVVSEQLISVCPYAMQLPLSGFGFTCLSSVPSMVTVQTGKDGA